MMNDIRTILLVSVISTAAAAQELAPKDAATAMPREFFRNYCGACHTGPKSKGDLDLEALALEKPDAVVLAAVGAVRQRIDDGDMPPRDKKQPTADERRAILDWAKSYVEKAKSKVVVDPGRVTLRRLSRTEYARTIRDLLAIETRVVENFPPDNLAYGFDNIGDALSFSLLHLEKYLSAAEEIAAAAISTDDPKNPAVRRLETEFMTQSEDGVSVSDAANFFSNGRVSQKIKLPRDGDYLLRVRCWADQAGPDLARMGLFLDGQKFADVTVEEDRQKPGLKEIKQQLGGGEREIAIQFLNDYWNPKAEDPKARDRNLHVDFLEIVGPVDERERPAAQRWIFAKDPGKGSVESRAKPVIETLLLRTWRRPPTSSEVTGLSGIVKKMTAEGEPFEEGIRAVLVAALVSPHFLFRVEPGDVGGQGATADLKDFALASRLSYFLWSSMPDDRLFEKAAKGELRKPDVLEAEARRMLTNERSEALARNFAAQWLELRNLDELTPDPKRFAEFTKDLRADLRREAELFFIDVLRAKRPVFDFIDPEDTFLNERLAKFYGVSGVSGEEFRRVKLENRRRGGILGQATMLALTSNPTRTSPVKRGKWILENILDAPPPPPTPGTDSLKDGDSITNAATLRERMAEHRKDPSCASCHDKMDALGFALENYDPIGRWRDEDGGLPIDAGGQFPDGRTIKGPEDLRTLLRRDPAFLRCVTKKLFVYAVGREVRPADLPAIDDMLGKLAPETVTLDRLILGIVNSDAFRKRKPSK